MEAKKRKLEKYHTPEEISENFNKVQAACFIQEETCSEEETLSYLHTYEILKRLEYSVIDAGMFSPNEGIKEIHLENLKQIIQIIH